MHSVSTLVNFRKSLEWFTGGYVSSGDYVMERSYRKRTKDCRDSRATCPLMEGIWGIWFLRWEGYSHVFMREPHRKLCPSQALFTQFS